MQKIKKGERASVSGVIISLKDYDILKEQKEYLKTKKELFEKLNAGEDV